MAGVGDELIATGLARGAAERGKRIAFGDGCRILWGPHSREIFKGNPNIAPPGSEGYSDIEWIHYYKGRRIYNVGHGNYWTWNYEFKPKPGEVFLDADEIVFAKRVPAGFVLIEPNVVWEKASAVNKDWGFEKYQAVADGLRKMGHRVAQLSYGRRRLANVEVIQAPSFRHSLAVLQRCALAVVPEGGLHHGAAAMGTKAIVLFGGFIPPEATGYEMHINLTAGGKACGRLIPCAHCRAAMEAITVDDVLNYAHSVMRLRYKTACA